MQIFNKFVQSVSALAWPSVQSPP